MPKYRAGGRVTLANGQPVAHGQVEFRHQTRGVSAIAYIDLAGKFELMTSTPGDGVYQGKYRAVLHAPPPVEGVSGQESEEDNSVKLRQRWFALVPARYQVAATSDLEFTVTEDEQENDFQIVLQP